MGKDIKEELHKIKRLLKYVIATEHMKHGGAFPEGISKLLPDIRDILGEKEE